MKVTKQGRLLNVIKAGEYFGEMACIKRGMKRQAMLEALSERLSPNFPFLRRSSSAPAANYALPSLCCSP